MRKKLIIGIVVVVALFILVQVPAINDAVFSSRSSRQDAYDAMDDLIRQGQKITETRFVYEQYIDPLYKLIKQEKDIAIKDMEFKYNQLIIVYEDPDSANFKNLTSTASFLLGAS